MNAEDFIPEKGFDVRQYSLLSSWKLNLNSYLKNPTEAIILSFSWIEFDFIFKPVILYSNKISSGTKIESCLKWA